MKFRIEHILLLILITTIGCVKKTEDMEGPTIGSLNIWADISMKDIVEQEEEIFERLYQYAHLDITYTNEREMFTAFLADTVDAVIANRMLSPEEMQYLHNLKSIPRHYAFATGAIAFVTNKAAADTTYTYEDIINRMSDMNNGAIFVIENVKSGITQEILRLIGQEELPSHFYALENKKEVLEYIDEHVHAIGIIDYSDISDSDTPFTQMVLEQFNLLGISRPIDSLQFGFVKPFQYNLQDNKYPFTRDMYFISKTGRNDVGLGFATFICAEIGQKIILKAGLLPKYQTERNIEFKGMSDVKVIK